MNVNYHKNKKIVDGKGGKCEHADDFFLLGVVSARHDKKITSLYDFHEQTETQTHDDHREPT